MGHVVYKSITSDKLGRLQANGAHGWKNTQNQENKFIMADMFPLKQNMPAHM